LVDRYRQFLPVTDATPRLTLGEGATPLVAAPRLGGHIGVPNLHLKLEGLNPTGSFKDRGMVVAVSKALESGGTSIICASTGNAGNITAYWAGFTEYAMAGIVETRPRMHGFQAAGAAPIVRGAPVERPETIATAIRIGNPATWAGAVAARDESQGGIDAVTDD